MRILKRAWRWSKRNWRYYLASIGIVLTIVLGIIYKRNKNKIQIQKHRIKVLQTKKKIAHLEGQREVIRRNENAVESDIKDIDKEIKNLDADIKVIRDEVSNLSNEEKLKRFKKLGY